MDHRRFGFYQWLNTEAPVTFREAGMGMLNQMLGSVIPSQIQVEMGPSMSMNILPSLGISSRTMPIGGSFNTPLLNGALFHQSTFRDLFGLKGVSFTAGLRLDYERMKMDYKLRHQPGLQGGHQGRNEAGRRRHPRNRDDAGDGADRRVALPRKH